MGSFRSPPGGIGVMPYDALGDIDTGIAPWGSAALSSFATGIQNTGVGYLSTQISLPPLALTVDRPPDTIRGVAPFREMTEAETNKRGYILASDPELFKKMFPSVPHEPGMTIERAIAIKDYQDSQAVRDFYMKDRPITSFFGQLTGSIPTPENFVPFLGQLGASLKVGRAAQLGISAARSSGEAVIGTALFDVATMEGRAQLGMDTSWKAMAMDIGFSALIGAGFGTVTGIFNTPSSSAITPSAAADGPEARARANVVLNDAIGSYLNSPDNAVHLGPQSYRYILDTMHSVPEQNITFTWDNITVSGKSSDQASVVNQVLSDPNTQWIRGTQVADESGTPKVVYTGTPVEIDRLTTPNQNIGVLFDQEQAARLSVKYNPDTWTEPINPKEYDGPETSAVRIGKKTFIGTEHQDALQNAINNLGIDHPSVKAFDKHPEGKIGLVTRSGEFISLEKSETMRGIKFQKAIENARKEGTTNVTKGDIGYKAINESVIWFSDKPQLAEARAKIPLIGTEHKPNVISALVDIKNPYIRSYKTMPNEMNRWSQLTVAKDNGHDGLILKIEDDGTGKPLTLYATWKPSNIINIADVSKASVAKEQAKVQAYATGQILNDPIIASMLEGTKVVDEKGQPAVVYTGSMVPMERRIETHMDTLGTGITRRTDPAFWFSTNPNHTQSYIEGLGTHPDVLNIDYPIDITKWKGPKEGIRAFKINNEYFIGGVHAEAIDKAVAYYGADSAIIKNFENLPFEEQIKTFGHLDEEGFTPGETAIGSKEEVDLYIREQREFLAKQEALSEKTSEGAYKYRIIPPRIEGALLDIKKPRIMDHETFLNDFKRREFIYETMDMKDKDGNPLYDGIIVKDVDIPIDTSTNLNTYEGDLVSVVRIGGKDWIGSSHADAMDKAEHFFGTDSPQMKAFNDAKDAMDFIGVWTKEKGLLFGKEADEILNAAGLNRDEVPPVTKFTERGTIYSVWEPENIFTMRDTSALRLRNEQAKKIAGYENASKLAQTNGYSYSQPQYRDYKNIQGTDYIPAVNLDVLAKEANILKYTESAVKAEGGDLKAGITPLDEQFKAFQANRELTQDVLKKIEEADIVMKKAGMLEQIMNLAVGCKDG